ncbi:MAG: hypothetical protein Q8K96_05960 [Rubrivivax sp.]|nr:hypothetical protein [Rubrivivax sp.]
MNRQPKPVPGKEEIPEPEIQQGDEHSIATRERLERAVRRHPQRDEPKIDSVEPDEVPPP